MSKTIVVAFLFCICGGITIGGEEREHMPMRGNGGDKGVARYNDFHAGPPRLSGEMRARLSGTPSGMDSTFIKWKNHCAVRLSRMEEGMPAEEPDFLLVAPYLSKPRAEPGGFFKALGF